MGLTKPRAALQLDELDAGLRTAIWNGILPWLNTYSAGSNYGSYSLTVDLVQKVFMDVINQPVDEAPRNETKAREWIKRCVLQAEWSVVYNVLDHIGQQTVPGRNALLENLNRAFELEGSGYRFVSGRIAPITNTAEIAAIEETVSSAEDYGLTGVRTHIDAAIAALSRKPEPDYRNSVKESISAVESAAKLISGERNGGLKDALRELARRSPIHTALVSGFEKLYGYTSDEDGVRHPILDDPKAVGFDEAKFMLVACSAFVNFLIAKADSAGLLNA